jgi:hypothetical protein
MWVESEIKFRVCIKASVLYRGFENQIHIQKFWQSLQLLRRSSYKNMLDNIKRVLRYVKENERENLHLFLYYFKFYDNENEYNYMISP